MASITKSPGTVVDAGGGSVAWSNPDNAKASDNTYATIYLGPQGGDYYTNYLQATNFGFNIPAGNIIIGILVAIKKARTCEAYTGITTSAVRLVKNGTIVGNNYCDSLWPASDTYSYHGGSNDLWGLTLTVSDVNSANFGVVLQAEIWSATLPPGGAVTGYVDHIQMTVYYAPPPSINGAILLMQL